MAGLSRYADVVADAIGDRLASRSFPVRDHRWL
jgi:hypothetical protein